MQVLEQANGTWGRARPGNAAGSVQTLSVQALSNYGGDSSYLTSRALTQVPQLLPLWLPME